MPNIKVIGAVNLKCYGGKELRINLTTSEIKVFNIDDYYLKNFIGGKGLGAKFLYESLNPKIDPLSDENMLIFAVGPINGLPFSSSSRVGVFFKSPLTGLFGESYCGGHLAPQMKAAGYDMVIIRGAASKPVYISISDSDVKIKNASHLWGKDTYETENVLKGDEGREVQVACIGPAAENLVKFATINHAEGRQFGRCGCGTVMGSKKLKAITIKGTGKVEAENKELLDMLRRDITIKIKEKLTTLISYGTPGIINVTNSAGALPTRYWTEGEFDGITSINAETMKDKLVKRSRACYICPIACGKISVVKSGPYVGTEVEGPEYETLYSFGSLCGNKNLEAIAKANEICDRLGLDTITAGNIVAFTMKCFDEKILTSDDLDGLELNFGNDEAMIDILPKIAYKKGFGAVLAEGVRGAAKMIGKGAEDLAIHVKGLEPAGYEPRALKGSALAYAVSMRGACHLRHLAYRPNLTGKHPFKENIPIDRFSYDRQAEIVKELEDFHVIVDSMIMCKFICLPTIGPVLWDEMCEIYSATTGLDVKVQDLMDIGIRVNNLVKTFNIREGATAKDDTLPKRMMREKLLKGASSGQIVDEEKFNKMLSEYYQLRGWNSRGEPKG